jgi:thymidylate kinase
MGSNNKTCIIEFIGLPGSGKTTTSASLQKHFLQKGLRVIKLTDLWLEMGKNRLSRTIRMIGYGGIKNLLAILLLILKTNFKDKETFNVFQYTYRLTAIYNYFLKGELPYDIMIADQGISQAIISVLYLNQLDDSNIHVSKYLKYINQQFRDIYFVNCYVNSNIAAQRIENRKQRTGRLDDFKGSELVERLDIQSKNIVNLNRITSKFWNRNIIDLNMSNDLEMNTQLVYNQFISISTYREATKN